MQVDLSALQQQLDTVRQAPEGADIAPSLDAIADLLGRPALPDAAASAARLVAEVAEGRQAAGAVACLQQQHRASTLFTLPRRSKAAHGTLHSTNGRLDLLCRCGGACDWHAAVGYRQLQRTAAVGRCRASRCPRGVLG